MPVLAYMQGLDVGGVFVHPFCLLGLGNMFEAVMQLAVFPTDKRLVRVFCCFQFGGTLFLTLRAAVALRAPLRHVLLHGPPGTGKTMVARHLAANSGLDYAIMSGGDVGPLGKEAAAELHTLLSWARRAPN